MTTVASARRDWEEGHRRFLAETRDPRRAEALHGHLDVLAEEIRRRVGQTFTLADLSRAYLDSERWAREAIGERAPTPSWALTLTLTIDEAFHRYSRGAVDYVP
jgi:hypothetical protein